MIVLLDSSVLGQLCNPNSSPNTIAVNNWMYSLLGKGVLLVSSHICDYEVRRSLILNSMRGFSTKGIDSLDELLEIIGFLPIDKKVLKTASQIWAEARNRGISTADEKSLDADVIICAQYRLL